MYKKEKDTLNLLKKGDKKGLKEVFELLYNPLCLYSHKFVGNMPAAEDLVQEVFISFWEDEKYLNINSNLGAYLYRTVKNQSLNYIRDNKLKLSDWQKEYDEIFFDEKENVDPYAKENILKKVHEAINQLPPGSRNVFQSIVIGGLSYNEAAEKYDISVNTIKTQLKRAIKLLSQMLDKLSFVILMEVFFTYFSK
jgi:RNA polymerase sigma-70 factor (ECF subfamily)